MSKENMKKIIVTAQCTNIEEEERLNRIIFGFNHSNETHAVKCTSELSKDLPYVLEVFIEENSLGAFIAYLNEFVPEASVQEKE
ncbi:MAG: hypothetical protein GX943_02920 [Candidatus Pacebacteria bacterium]|jgi:PII-like signaling protein|nr:hypothetical protein [Candidatus Paceibacterota bacterium]